MTLRRHVQCPSLSPWLILEHRRLPVDPPCCLCVPTHPHPHSLSPQCSHFSVTIFLGTCFLFLIGRPSLTCVKPLSLIVPFLEMFLAFPSVTWFLASKPPFLWLFSALWSLYLGCHRDTVRLGHHWPVSSLLPPHSPHLMLVSFHNCPSSCSDFPVKVFKILLPFFSSFLLHYSSPYPTPGALCQARLAHLLCPPNLSGTHLFPGHSPAALECPLDSCWCHLLMGWMDAPNNPTQHCLPSSVEVC